MQLMRFAAWCGLALVLLAGCDKAPTPLKSGQPAPPFALESLDGRQMVFPEDLRGRVVALRFWADWCPFCKGEMGAIEPIYQRRKGEGLAILAINVAQSRSVAQRFVEGLGISYDVLLDPEGEVFRAYGVVGLPTTYFIGPDGTLRAKILGESDPHTFERMVEEILKEEGGAS